MPRIISHALIALVILTAFISACAPKSPAQDPKQILIPLNANLSEAVSQARTTLTNLSTVPELRGNDPGPCSIVVSQQVLINKQFTLVAAARGNGDLWCIPTGADAPVNVADRTYFTRAMQTKDFSVGDYQIGRVSGKASVGTAYPMYSPTGDFRGVVLAPFDLAWVNVRLLQQKYPPDSEVFGIDSQGTVLAYWPTFDAYVGKSEADSPLVKAMLTQFVGSGDYVGLDGVTRNYAFQPIDGSNKNWIIAAGVKP